MLRAEQADVARSVDQARRQLIGRLDLLPDGVGLLLDEVAHTIAEGAGLHR
jgi:hypothetical protein